MCIGIELEYLPLDMGILANEHRFPESESHARSVVRGAVHHQQRENCKVCSVSGQLLPAHGTFVKHAERGAEPTKPTKGKRQWWVQRGTTLTN